jgi:hypothetical protein
VDLKGRILGRVLIMKELKRLNLGAGQLALSGYDNIDRSYPGDLEHMGCFAGEAYPLTQYEDESVDEVRASHILEHFSHGKTADVLREWIRVLKPGGILKVAVPNFAEIVQRYIEDADVQSWVMGGHVDENDTHGAIFDESGLTAAMQGLGLESVGRWEPDVDDCAASPISLNLQGFKRGSPNLKNQLIGVGTQVHLSNNPSVIGKVEDFCEDEPASIWVRWECDPKCSAARMDGCCLVVIADLTIDVPCIDPVTHPLDRFSDVTITNGKMLAVQTVPRLGFTAHMQCALLALGSLGVPLVHSGGVFWSQGIERVIEQAVDGGYEYVLVSDFDTVFDARHVKALYGLMEWAPQIDALCPVQMRREMPVPLVTLKDADGNNLDRFDPAQLAQDVTPVATGHFGLTIIRASSLAGIAKPWFWEQPDEEGRWGDRRQDADIAFWNKFREAGKTLYQANRVVVGHLELMVTWPDHSMRPVFQYGGDYAASGDPGRIWR